MNAPLFDRITDPKRDHRDDGDFGLALLIAVPVGLAVWALLIVAVVVVFG